MDTVGFPQLMGMSWRIAMLLLLLGGVAILVVILANARGGRSRAPGTLLAAMLAVGVVLMLSMFAGPSRRSTTATHSDRSGIAATRSSGERATARATEKTESHLRDDHGSAATSTTDIDLNADDEHFGIVISSDGDSRTISLGHRVKRLGTRLDRVGSRMSRLGQRLHARLDGTLGVSGTRWVISGSAIFALMFVGYVVLSATAKGRFNWPLRVLSVMTLAAIIACIAAVRHVR